MLCGGEKMEQKLRRDRNLGDNLRRLRNASGRSQEKLCAELQRRGCDIGRTTYAKYEAGELNVRVSVLLALKKLGRIVIASAVAVIQIDKHDLVSSLAQCARNACAACYGNIAFV